ncbi:MAG: hypothetical protein SWE60_21575, partial [Thermodesulfobacteriota bacterium]|nr:hypothetical protein [Thermodesulfobacteriota bacterium]
MTKYVLRERPCKPKDTVFSIHYEDLLNPAQYEAVTTLQVHVHTHDPGAALSYVTSMGRLRQVKVQNMDEQHEEFIAAG